MRIYIGINMPTACVDQTLGDVAKSEVNPGTAMPYKYGFEQILNQLSCD